MEGKNANKLVSVIMPTYNAVKHLKEAIDSIIRQTYSDWELLIIDDGSTDGTQEIIQSYCERDSRIKLIAGPMQGIAAALNLGIDKSEGEYVARMDADDISLPERLEKQVYYMEKNEETDVCATLFKILSEKNAKDYVIQTPYCDDAIKAKMIFECTIGHPTVMFRKKTLDQGWRYDTHAVAEDYDLWTRMIPDLKFICLQQVLLYYRKSDESASHIRQDDVILSAQNSSKNCIGRIFKIDLSEYSNEYFGQVSNWRKVKIPYFTFLRKELRLLYEIDSQNQALNVLDQKSLREVLLFRWKTMTDFVKPVLADLWEIKSSNNFDLYSIFNGKVLLEEYCSKLNLVEKAYKEWVKKNIVFAIYGMGKRGKELLQQYLFLKKNSQIGWRLSLLVDKNIVSIKMKDTEFLINKPSSLADHNIDIILISSSIYYEEIRREIIEIGIGEEKIVSGNVLLIL